MASVQKGKTFVAGSRVHRAGRPSAAGVRTSRGGNCTFNSRTLRSIVLLLFLQKQNLEYSRDPHAMEGAACCMRVWCLDTAGCTCDAGPAAAGTTAGLAGMRCGMRGGLRLMRCVLRTVRNDAHPRTFHTLSQAASVHAHALYPAGDVLEYNISTCILERLANPTACIVVEGPL